MRHYYTVFVLFVNKNPENYTAFQRIYTPIYVAPQISIYSLVLTNVSFLCII